jgi:hypothetical protein
VSRWNRRNLARTDELLQGAGVFRDAFADLDSDALLERIVARAARTPRPADTPPGHRAPAGALTSARLLYLSGCAEGAGFWWRFASGAGVATAAYCLYLHHTQSSEEEMARFWFGQAHRLHHQAGASLYPRPDPALATELIKHLEHSH